MLYVNFTRRNKMRHLYEFLMISLMVVTTILGVMFAVDREMARRDSIKNPDGQVTGCLWEINCNYYNKG